MEEVERNLKEKQLRALTEALEGISWQRIDEGYVISKDPDVWLSPNRWLAEQLWEQGIRGVYKIRSTD